MRRVVVWMMAALLTVSLTVGCKKSETCENFVEKSASCRKKKLDPIKLAKMKAFVVAICLAQKADKDMGKFAKKRIACIHQKTCEEFKECVKEVRKSSRVVRYRVSVRKKIAKLKELVKEEKYHKAQSRCTYSYAAKALMKSKDKADHVAAKAFYDFCLDNIPTWLGKLRDGGTKKSYFSACRGKKFFAESGANDKQKAAIAAVCKELKVVGIVNRIAKNAGKYVEKGRMYYGCSEKNAEKLAALTSPAGKKLLAKFKNICYLQIGVAVLKAEKAKLEKRRRRRYRYCPYGAKKVVKAFRKYEDLAKPEHKELLDFFYKICK